MISCLNDSCLSIESSRAQPIVPIDSPAVIKPTVISQVHGEKIPGMYFREADDTLNKREFLCTGHLSKALLFYVLCPGLVVFRALSPCLSKKKMRVFFQYP